MKTFLTLTLLSASVFAAPADKFKGTPFDYKREKFAECVIPSCILQLCEQGEIVERMNFVPVVGCNKAMRKNKDGKFTLDYYEIGIKEIAFPSKEEGGRPDKPAGILFRFR